LGAGSSTFHVTSTLDFLKKSQLQSPVMRFDWPTIKRIIQHCFAVFLLLWWGGLNCLSGCLTADTDAAGESYCPMSGKGGSCCHAQSGKTSRSSKSIGAPSSSLQSLSCCSLLSLTAEERRDTHAHDEATATAIFNPIEFTPESEPRAEFPGQWARLPGRGGTHILHCVFLI
jgi:hypothetical protein